MKFRRVWIVVFLALFPTFSRADSGGSPVEGGGSYRRGSGGGFAKKSFRGRGDSKSGKNTRELRGTCTLKPGTSNPIGGPCVNILLILKSGVDEIARARTSNQGVFQFIVPDAIKSPTLQILPGSRYYGVISPEAGTVKPGRSPELILQMK